MLYVFLAEGFEEIEALTPVDLLRRAGVEVLTVGVGAKVITGAHGIPVTADTTLDTLDENLAVEGILLPGGLPGTTNLEKSAAVLRHVARAAEQGKLVCAICAAPSIPGHMGLLAGKKATAYPGYEPELHGAVCTGAAVCTDGQFITACGAGVAAEFGFAVITALRGAAVAAKIRASIQCR